MRHNHLVRRWGLPRGVLVAVCAIAAALCLPAAASAADGQVQVLKAVKGYPGQSTFSCRTDAIPIHPGQNINDLALTQTCPHAQRISGSVSPSVFNKGSKTKGFITRFKPSMLEVHDDGSTTTPPVWDLHLHHVVWIDPHGGPTFASGEEKTIPKLPRGYGYEVAGGANWMINQMIHELNAREGRSVYITWEIDWVPETPATQKQIQPATVRWMDVAGLPHLYPVFDATKRYDLDKDGKYVFPDDVPTDPSQPGYSQRANISRSHKWVVPKSGATLVFTAGHMHPGGLHTDLTVSRDGPDPGSTPGDSPEETVPLFRSKAHYFEPAGAVSWDVSMTATPRDWRIHLKPGDVVDVSVTYNVKRGDWYESMGIMPLLWSTAHDPAARDPFDNPAQVGAMYKEDGILTHGRLPENKDTEARTNLKLPDPRKLRNGPKVPKSGVDIDGFFFKQGGYSAVKGFPKKLMRPVVVKEGQSLTFTNQEALPGTSNEDQVWHSITTCKAPCNKGSGIGYPLAKPTHGGLDFDSGQLGYGQSWSSEVTTGSNQYTTPVLKKPGTYTYFCRIHPYMRGTFRVIKSKSGGYAVAPGSS